MRTKMIKMGYGSLLAYAPSGYDIFVEVSNFVLALGATALGYLIAQKLGYSNYLALIIAGISGVFYLITGLPGTAVILMFALFGVGELLGAHGFILNPTLIGSGGGGGGT
jgi:hypothetical protein